MRIFTTSFKKLCLVALFAIFGINANATVYTALISGNFNVATTWVGGLIPGSLLSTDAVVIPLGINVTLTTVQTFSGTAALTVNGTLSSTTGSALVMTSGTLAGTGTISADSMVLGLTSGLTFTGNITARRLNSLGANLSTASTVTVNNLLNLSAGTLNVTGGSLIMGNLSTINMSGGTMTGTSGMLHLDSVYNVMYTTTSSSTGTELTGTGLNNIMVNVPGTVTLSANQAVNGMLTLTSGSLLLNGHTLTFNSTGNLASSGSGTITGSTLSNVVINGASGLTGTLRFASGGNVLNNLTVNTVSSGTTSLGSDLSLNGMLTLTGGTLDLNGHTLTLNSTGDMASSGTGSLMGSATSNLIINTASSLTGTLRFATGGNMLNNLTLNSGAGSMANLAGDLTLGGMLTLTGGSLGLNGHTLTLGSAANVAASGTGSLMGSATSNLIINTTGSLTGAIRFATGGNMLNILTVNSGAGSMANLGSDLTVGGLMTLTSGSLGLNGHTLTLGSAANLSGSGTGTLMGSAASNLVINTTGSLTGSLRFATGGDMLNNLTVNTGSGSSNVNLGSSLTVGGALNLTSGRLGLGANNLSIATSGMINGGSANSYVMTDGTGRLMINLAAGSSDSFMVGTTTGFAPMVVTANAGSASGNVGVNVMNGVLAGGTTGSSISATMPLVNATWDVTSSASTGINYNLMAMWSAGMEVNGFNRTQAYLSHYTSGAWDLQTASAAGTSGSMYTMSRTGLTSLSPFMVADRNAPVAVPNVAVNQASVSIYPNPATTTLSFTTSAIVENAAIYDMSGRFVKSANTANSTINIQDLPTGTYFIHFLGQNIHAVQKFVKQ